jgi:hypothetical protein
MYPEIIGLSIGLQALILACKSHSLNRNLSRETFRGGIHTDPEMAEAMTLLDTMTRLDTRILCLSQHLQLPPLDPSPSDH